MWTITDAKGNERGRFDIEADAWKEYDRLSELAGCLGPYRVKFNRVAITAPAHASRAGHRQALLPDFRR